MGRMAAQQFRNLRAISPQLRALHPRLRAFQDSRRLILRRFDNCRRVSRRRSYRFDRARHRVFAHRAPRRQDRMRADSPRKARV